MFDWSGRFNYLQFIKCELSTFYKPKMSLKKLINKKIYYKEWDKHSWGRSFFIFQIIFWGQQFTFTKIIKKKKKKENEMSL